MPIDNENQAGITILAAAGYTVTADETPDGRWRVRAVNRNTDEQSEIEADDPYAGVAEMGRQLGVPLDVS